MPATPSSFDRELQALADEERRASKARARLQRADRKIMDGLSGSFVGTLIEIAETHAPVTVLTRTEAAVRGTIATVGTNVVAIRTAGSSSEVLIRIGAIEGLLESGSGHNRSNSTTSTGPTFAELLDRYSETNERIAATTTSGNTVMGTVQRVGEDQVVLSLDGSGDTLTVPTSAIDQVVTSR